MKEIVITGRNVIETEEVTVRAGTENKIDLVELRLVSVTIYRLGIIIRDQDNIQNKDRWMIPGMIEEVISTIIRRVNITKNKIGKRKRSPTKINVRDQDRVLGNKIVRLHNREKINSKINILIKIAIEATIKNNTNID